MLNRALDRGMFEGPNPARMVMSIGVKFYGGAQEMRVLTD